jgi:hypothetical protein
MNSEASTPTRSYNIKFNKTLYRRTLVSDTRGALVGWLVAILLAGGGYELAVMEILPNWLFIVFVVISLYLVVAPIWLVADWMEYRRIHVKKNTKKPES